MSHINHSLDDVELARQIVGEITLAVEDEGFPSEVRVRNGKLYLYIDERDRSAYQQAFTLLSDRLTQVDGGVEIFLPQFSSLEEILEVAELGETAFF